jgi:hypothetical protein
MTTLTIDYKLNKKLTEQAINNLLNKAGGTVLNITSNENESNLDKWFYKYKPDIYDYSVKSLVLRSKVKCIKKYNEIKLPNGEYLYFNKTINGWITSKRNRKYLPKIIYSVKDDASYDDYLSDLSDCEELENYIIDELSDLTYSYYKNGIIIIPNKTYSKYGQSYFHNGYWNKTLKGWVFSRKHEQTLKDKGVTYVKCIKSSYSNYSNYSSVC